MKETTHQDHVLSALKKALIAQEKTQTQLNALRTAQSEPIAIVGLSCRFPGGANDLNRYWLMLQDGIDAIEEIPLSRWNIEEYYDQEPGKPGKMLSRSGGFLDDIDLFDAHFFGISPREALTMDPQQRLLLETSWEALEYAGIAPIHLKGTATGVFVGVSWIDYVNVLRLQEKAVLDTYYLTGNSLNVIPGRLAYLLDLHGPCMAIDAACASSLVSLHMACQSLRQGECDMALSAGINLILSPQVNIAFSTNKITLAPDGRCKTFDKRANGFVRSEGCAVVALKRLSDAKKAKDNIVGIIRGSAMNQCGRTSGLTVPSAPAQERLIKKALLNANVTPAEISYLEAHGTGTSLGDPIEAAGLNAVYKGSHSEEHPLWLGSVKTNIGHCEAAAGMAGLIKVILSFQHEKIPPHLHYHQPHPDIDLSLIPAAIPTQLQPWVRSDRKRLAGISSFGFSGANAHVIVEEGIENAVVSSEVERPLHVLTLSARTATALDALLSRYQDHLTQHTEQSFADIAYTANVGRNHFEERLAIVASNREQAIDQLKTYKKRPSIFNDKPKLAFFYTSEGCEYSGMGKELYETHPGFKEAIDVCATALNASLDIPLHTLLFAENNASIHKPPYTQAALFALHYGLTVLCTSWGIRPDVIKGYASGKWMTAVILNEMTLDEAWRAYQQFPHETQADHLIEDECNVIIKIGPQPILPGMIKGAIISKKTIWLATLSRGIGEWEIILNSVAQLYQLGLTIHWDAFDEVYKRRKVVLPTYPFQRQRYWPEIAEANQAARPSSEAQLRTDSAITDMHYEMVWQPQALDALTISDIQGTWLVFSEQATLIDLLTNAGIQCLVVTQGNAFQELSPHTYTVDPFCKENFVTLFEKLSHTPSLKGVLYAWGLDRLEDSWEIALPPITAGFLHLTQALFAKNNFSSLSLRLVTEGAHYTTKSSAPKLAQTALSGLHRTIVIEHSGLETRHIDLDPRNKSDHAQLLLDELRHKTDEQQVAYNQEVRLVPRLERIPIVATSPIEEKMVFQADASYLITGGMGGLGLKVAELAVENGAKHLVLLTRKNNNLKAQADVALLKNKGVTIEIIEMNVASSKAMTKLIPRFGNEWPLLKGIIHAAGSISDAAFLNLTWENFLTVFSSKLFGTWNIHQQTQSLVLDFFVTFSSGASIFGSAGQANYAAANSFMDALAQHRKVNGLPINNINWGPWNEVGMATRSRSSSQGLGIKPLPVRHGLNALMQLLQMPDQTHAIILIMDWKAFKNRLKNIPSFYQNVITADNKQTLTEQSAIVKKLLEAHVTKHPTLLVGYLKEKMKLILRWQASEDISEFMHLLEFGLDSLMAIELRHSIQLDLGSLVELSQTIIFEYPTLKQLAEYISQEIQASLHETPVLNASSDVPEEIAQLNSEELDAMLTSVLNDSKIL